MHNSDLTSPALFLIPSIPMNSLENKPRSVREAVRVRPLESCEFIFLDQERHPCGFWISNLVVVLLQSYTYPSQVRTINALKGASDSSIFNFRIRLGLETYNEATLSWCCLRFDRNEAW